MNIQGVNQNISAQGASRQSDPRLKSLDQQISELEKRIREVRKNEKLDPKSKQEKIKEYEKQIQLLQQEKAKVQAEERQNKQKPAESDQPSVNKDTNNKNNTIDEHVQNAFVKMDSMKKSEKALGMVREQAKSELRIAESKSILRTPDPAAAAAARGKLAKIDRAVLRKGAEVTGEFGDASYESVSMEDRLEQEEDDSEKTKKGTGRMEPGQFLDDEA